MFRGLRAGFRLSLFRVYSSRFIRDVPGSIACSKFVACEGLCPGGLPTGSCEAQPSRGSRVCVAALLDNPSYPSSSYEVVMEKEVAGNRYRYI